jgi:hypothetical protein
VGHPVHLILGLRLICLQCFRLLSSSPSPKFLIKTRVVYNYVFELHTCYRLTLNTKALCDWPTFQCSCNTNFVTFPSYCVGFVFIPSNAELKPICHLLALSGAHHIFHVSGKRVTECQWQFVPAVRIAQLHRSCSFSHGTCLTLCRLKPSPYLTGNRGPIRNNNCFVTWA